MASALLVASRGHAAERAVEAVQSFSCLDFVTGLHHPYGASNKTIQKLDGQLGPLIRQVRSRPLKHVFKLIYFAYFFRITSLGLGPMLKQF